MKKNVLSVSNLCSGYGQVEIINKINFTVNQGEILAIIGRNGVGKTTLIKTLIGEVQTKKGDIELNGKKIQRMSSYSRAQSGIGYVPQGRGLFNNLSVYENLKLGNLVGGKPKKMNFDRTFEFFPILKERISQIAGTLSGGQQQQLSIGRILVGNPSIILLDEPSEGIQPNIVQSIGKIIKRIRDDEGISIIIVEQNLELIQASADRCLVVEKGKIIKELSPQDLSDPSIAKKYLAV